MRTVNDAGRHALGTGCMANPAKVMVTGEEALWRTFARNGAEMVEVRVGCCARP